MLLLEDAAEPQENGTASETDYAKSRRRRRQRRRRVCCRLSVGERGFTVLGLNQNHGWRSVAFVAVSSSSSEVQKRSRSSQRTLGA